VKYLRPFFQKVSDWNKGHNTSFSASLCVWVSQLREECTFTFTHFSPSFDTFRHHDCGWCAWFGLARTDRIEKCVGLTRRVHKVATNPQTRLVLGREVFSPISKICSILCRIQTNIRSLQRPWWLLSREHCHCILMPNTKWFHSSAHRCLAQMWSPDSEGSCSMSQAIREVRHAVQRSPKSADSNSRDIESRCQ
jgi:hypothetical protein